jgi:thioredoxin 1
MYEGLKNEYASKVSLEDVDVDETPAIAEKYGVTSLPTILFIKGEDVVDSHKGALTKSALKGKIDNFLS